MRRVDPGRAAPFLIPILVGAVLRLVGLTREPLWVDEILTLQSASIGEPFRLVDVLRNPQGPLPQVLLRAWTALAGSGDLALRLWSATASILGLVAGLFAFRALVPRAAVLSLWFLALSPFQIWYAHEVRNYAFLLAAALLALWSFVAAERRPAPGRWLAHGILLAATALCNLSGVFLIPVLGLIALRGGRRRFLGWVGAAAFALVLVSPWLVVTARGHLEWSAVTGSEPAGEPIRGGNTFDLLGLPFTFAVFLGGYGLAPPLRDLHEGLPVGEWLRSIPGLLVGAAAVAVALAGAWRIRKRERTGLLLVAAFLPALLVALVAATGLKPFNPRYAAVSQPAFLALLAMGAIAWSGRSAMPGRIAIAGILCCMALGWGRQTFDRDYGKEDFRSVAEYLTGAAAPTDLVLEQGVNGPLERYYRGAAPVATWFAVYFRGEDEGRGRFRNFLSGRRRVWWVGSRLWYEDPDGRVLAWLQAAGRTVETREWTGVRLVAVDIGDAGR